VNAISPSPTHGRRFRVDAALAHLVAEDYLSQRCAPHDPVIATAYRQLGEQADRWFALLTSPGRGVRVVFTADPDPYLDAEELRESVRSDRILELHSAANDRHRRHPLFDAARGGSLDRFRAVHDIVSHAWGGHAFDRDGEYSAWRAERRLYRGMAAAALATELHAHHSVRWTTGEVAPYRAVLIAPHLVRASLRAGHVEGS